MSLYSTTLTVLRGIERIQAARITWETASALYDITVYQNGEFMRAYPCKTSGTIVNKMERIFKQLRPLMEAAAFHPFESERGRDAYWELWKAVEKLGA